MTREEMLEEALREAWWLAEMSGDYGNPEYRERYEACRKRVRELLGEEEL